MKFSNELTDDALLQETGERIAQRRKLLQFTQAELAREAGVSRSTIERLEAGHSVQLTNLLRVLRRLELLENIEALLPPATPTPMEILKRGQPRQRVRHSSKEQGEKWTWGDEP